MLKLIDLSSGSLSLGSIERLRQAEHLGQDQMCFMPSKGQTQHVKKVLSKYADRISPCAIEETDTSESMAPG